MKPILHQDLPLKSEARLNYCFITETYPPEINGAAMTIHRLVEGLRAKNHTVSTIRPSQAKHLVPIKTKDDTITTSLPFPWYKEIRIGWPAINLIKSKWKISHPDLVYIATEGPLGWAAIYVARKFKIPIISGFHTNFHSYCDHYGWGSWTHILLSYLRLFHNFTHCTLVPSSYQKSLIRKGGIRDVEILGRGVDTQFFNPSKRSYELHKSWGVTESTIVALYVGRIAPEKNINLVLATYRHIKNQNIDIKLVIVGDGPMKQQLEEKNTDVIFTGSKTGEDLARHYASGDIFLFPSETETFGNVTLEAMASGLAVVAYDYAAAKMHIKHGVSGIKAPCGEKQLYKDAALQLVNKRLMSHEIKKAARRHTLNQTWHHVINRFQQISRDILESCRQPSRKASLEEGSFFDSNKLIPYPFNPNKKVIKN